MNADLRSIHQRTVLTPNLHRAGSGSVVLLKFNMHSVLTLLPALTVCDCINLLTGHSPFHMDMTDITFKQVNDETSHHFLNES